MEIARLKREKEERDKGLLAELEALRKQRTVFELKSSKDDEKARLDDQKNEDNIARALNDYLKYQEMK